MALTPDISFTKDGTTLKVVDNTIYGGSNPDRNQVSVALTIYRKTIGANVEVGLPSTYDATTWQNIEVEVALDGIYCYEAVFSDNLSNPSQACKYTFGYNGAIDSAGLTAMYLDGPILATLPNYPYTMDVAGAATLQTDLNAWIGDNGTATVSIKSLTTTTVQFSIVIDNTTLIFTTAEYGETCLPGNISFTENVTAGIHKSSIIRNTTWTHVDQVRYDLVWPITAVNGLGTVIPLGNYPYEIASDLVQLETDLQAWADANLDVPGTWTVTDLGSGNYEIAAVASEATIARVRETVGAATGSLTNSGLDHTWVAKGLDEVIYSDVIESAGLVGVTENGMLLALANYPYTMDVAGAAQLKTDLEAVLPSYCVVYTEATESPPNVDFDIRIFGSTIINLNYISYGETCSPDSYDFTETECTNVGVEGFQTACLAVTTVLDACLASKLVSYASDRCGCESKALCTKTSKLVAIDSAIALMMDEERYIEVNYLFDDAAELC
jgi:hypothetical protein